MGVTHLSGLAVSGVPTMGIAGMPPTTGNVFFVNSVTGSNGNPGTAQFPYATIAGAYAACLADNGDTIVCTAGHQETISAAGGLTLNKSGVTIVGWGQGNDRPLITFATSTAATVLITGANTVFTNFVATTSIDQIVSPFVVQAANCTLGVEWHDGASNKEALRAVLTSAAASNFTLNLTYFGFTNGSHGVNAVRLVGANGAFLNIDYYGICTTAVVEFFTTACVNVQIQGYFYVSGTTNLSKNVVDTVTGSTWAVSNAFDGAAGLAFDGGSAKAVASTDITSVTNVQESCTVSSNTGTMVNGATIFTIAGGPILIVGLFSVCQTANDATASTLQYQANSTLGTLSQTISGASATLANAVVGTVVTLVGTTLATAPVINANGSGLTTQTPIVANAGTIKIVIGVGSTVGTWKHYLRWQPMQPGVTVS